MKKSLSREQILAADDRPPAVKAMQRGRRPKWTATEVDRELAVAIGIELERRRRGIAKTRTRTPADIFDAFGGRSAARFFAKHRQDAARWADAITAIEAKRKRTG
jgi:hypothetical protein